MLKTIAAVAAGFLLGAASQKHQVARMWHGTVPLAKADEYQRYLYESGVKELKAIPKNEGVELLRRDDGKNAEFVVISYWPDKDAIHAYAGKDIDHVHDLPRDPSFLGPGREKLVKHFEVIAFEK
jgi:heme-degrading monooxygenase HmoA